jgi:KDO2-lipid IV(A) lauroyltransferase
MIKIINYFIQSVVIYLFFLTGRVLGLKFSRKIFSFLFSFFGPFFKSKKIIDSNLEKFSNHALTAKEKIINSMWRNYGMTFIEYIFLSNFRKDNSHIQIKGEKKLIDIIAKKKQVIFISGHFANFELMSMEITKRNISLATIYRPLNNIFLNPFMEYLRKKYICKNQIKKGINGVREVVEYINAKSSIALMIDQRVSEGELINFFGNPALTTTLPAQLSMKYNIEIMPVSIKRKEDHNFIIQFHDTLNPKKFKNKIELTHELNKVLEQMIIENPGQWIWSHNRWK